MARSKEFDENKTVDKAKELFWLQGYEATSIQDLVDHLGISRSSLYDTFSDKRSLFLYALGHYQQSEYERLAAIFKQDGFNKTTLERTFREMIDQALGDKTCRGCFTVNSTVELAQQDSEVAQMYSTARGRVEELFYQALVNAQEAGELATTHSPQTLAHFLFSVAQSIQVTAKTRPDRQVLQDIVGVALSVLN